MIPLVRRLLDTMLPPNCLACDTPVEDDGLFCLPCFRVASFVSAPFCARCGVPLPHLGAAGPGGECVQCQALEPCFTQARAALRYDAVSQRVILPFKYADRPEAARGIAKLMLRPGATMLSHADLLVPVPMHVKRLKSRRYNQAALLAQELARLVRVPCEPDALIRAKATAALERMGLAARQAELEGAIVLRPGAVVAGRRVVLVDDVMTSGTTAHACASVLLDAGARQVDVLTAARVADPRFE